ncbi:hypothetical protein KUTeg_008686 [Tegillarca granosa]|uniref:Radical SAM core domain-containing protein n=1 Tax=Tegillarca granosa TaxID=220873 RepID=A0ABQ9FCX0_TEGGR|nr:hypothetical protein KUTeg_008686 [Tegillarca granosa]
MVNTEILSVTSVCSLVLVLVGVFGLYLKRLRKQNAASEELYVNRIELEDKYSETARPVSVNYHFTRKCNYQCGFCFHTAKTSFLLPLDEAKQGLRLLKDAGMEKINFSGGEPFLIERGKYVGELVKFCKEELSLPSVTIVSNGSLVTEKWFDKYGCFQVKQCNKCIQQR